MALIAVSEPGSHWHRFVYGTADSNRVAVYNRERWGSKKNPGDRIIMTIQLSNILVHCYL